MNSLWKGGKDGEREEKREGAERQANRTSWTALCLPVSVITATNAIMYIQKLTLLLALYTCASLITLNLLILHLWFQKTFLKLIP